MLQTGALIPQASGGSFAERALLWPPGQPFRAGSRLLVQFHPSNESGDPVLAQRPLKDTNRSVANGGNREICFGSVLLIQTKLLVERYPGKARKLPNYRAKSSDMLDK